LISYTSNCQKWGLISLDWDLSLRLAYTVGVIDGSLRGSESYVASPDGGSDGGGGGTGGGDNETTSSRGFAAGGGSGGGTATGEVEKYSDVLWLNQGADRYCVEEERAPLSYGVPRGERSAYCEFEYFFREDVATALNVTTSRVQMLLIKVCVCFCLFDCRWLLVAEPLSPTTPSPPPTVTTTFTTTPPP
jgi:hypothetical protein